MATATSTPKTLRRTHQLLSVQSVVVILLSINRLTDLTLAYVARNEFLMSRILYIESSG
jgi:hypothetical protein